MNSGKRLDVGAYGGWAGKWSGRADAIAGLDDIEGDWRKSLRNYESQPDSFPTFHDSDPWDLLDDLIPMARERGGWIGVGLKPPRQGKEDWVRETLDRVPADLHVHGWALRLYWHLRRLDSVDSTNWWRDAQALLTYKKLRGITPAQAVQIIVWRYQQENRMLDESANQGGLF